MVYCPKCGTENEEDALNCKECGESLYPPSYRRYRRRREEDWCFGTRGGVPIWGIIFGLFIVLWGITSLLGDAFGWASWNRLWQFFVIAIGLLFVINALSRR